MNKDSGFQRQMANNNSFMNNFLHLKTLEKSDWVMSRSSNVTLKSSKIYMAIVLEWYYCVHFFFSLTPFSVDKKEELLSACRSKWNIYAVHAITNGSPGRNPNDLKNFFSWMHARLEILDTYSFVYRLRILFKDKYKIEGSAFLILTLEYSIWKGFWIFFVNLLNHWNFTYV